MVQSSRMAIKKNKIGEVSTNDILDEEVVFDDAETEHDVVRKLRVRLQKCEKEKKE